MAKGRKRWNSRARFKTALDLFRPFPLGKVASRVCAYCFNTREIVTGCANSAKLPRAIDAGMDLVTKSSVQRPTARLPLPASRMMLLSSNPWKAPGAGNKSCSSAHKLPTESSRTKWPKQAARSKRAVGWLITKSASNDHFQQSLCGTWDPPAIITSNSAEQ